MDIGAWLRGLGLERYERAFRDGAVDAEVLPDLTDGHLRELGLPLGHRLKLLKAIAALRDGPAQGPTPPPAPAAAAAAADGGGETPAAWEASRAERRQLTIMFADLVGSTALSVRLDPEDLSEVIGAYQRAVPDVIGRWGGHVAKYLGDGVLAYFGYPEAHEDDAERAVRAGLGLAEAVGALRPRPGLALQARIGIATGLVVVGDLIGEGMAREEAVAGETPNLAARLQALADPGSVVIAPGTRRLLGGLFDLADLGALTVKGFAEPVRAWSVLRPSAVESRFEALRSGTGLIPLVGREHELGLLLERWEQSKEGEGQVVLLSGEPGIGKSRLIRSLRARLADEPHTPLSHFCSPFHRNTAFYPVIALLERAAGLTREDSPERQLAKLEALLGLAAEDIQGVAPLLANLLSIPVGGRYPPLDLTPQRQKERTLRALVDQLAGLAVRRPVLALWEDVHWVDPSTLELLGLVVDRVQRLPVLVIITFRPEFMPPWTGYGHVTALALGRLRRRQGAAMIERVVGGGLLPAQVAEQIVVKADGVPLFVEELTKAVLESGLLKYEGDRYALAGPLPLLAIPATLQDSLMARLDRLGPAKEVAQIGAVLGREFSLDLLAAVAPVSEAELQAALGRLVASGLLFRRGVASDTTYSFKHALIQDAAYQSLLRTKRREWHARIADVLEARFADLVGAAPELIARHLTEAGLPGRAFERWFEAGRRARARSADAEAAEHLTKALESLKALPENPGRDQQELDVQLNIGPALLATRGFGASDVERAYKRAWELCEKTGARDRLLETLQALRICLMVRGDLQAAKHLGEQLIGLAEREQDPLFRAEGHRALGIVALFRGRLRTARDHLEQALALYEPHTARLHHHGPDGDPRVVACAHLGSVLLWLGLPDQARERGREALTSARTAGHPFSLAQALGITCTQDQQRRDIEATEEHANELVGLSGEHGFTSYSAFARCKLGWTMAKSGDPARGIGMLRDGLQDLERVGARMLRAFHLPSLAEVLAEQGDTEGALELLTEAKALVKSTGLGVCDPALHVLAGDLCREQEAADTTEDCFHAAARISEEQGNRLLALRAATKLARLWVAQGKRAEAHDLLAPVYGWFTEGFDTQDLRDAKALLDELR